ncbi:MAG: ATP-dependent DNA helicase [Pseudomonadales bacterium]|nr:ATP-dependent DNA helicase [Pseudomonadales bacterium]
MTEVFRVSVGHLAAFVHRHGDLGRSDNPPVRAFEGLRRQQCHQAAQGTRYRREVRLEGRWEERGVRLLVAGRADGVEIGPHGVVVEEIKTFRGDVSTARQRAGAMHDAQAMLYAAMLLATAAPETGVPRVRVLYLDADAERLERFEHAPTREALAAFFARTCAAYLSWLTAEAAYRTQRDAALEQLSFPMARFRPGQRGLARTVFRTLRDGETLLAEAPTGIGKTLAVLYGSLRVLPRGAFERVLYLTMRGSGRRLALEAARQLREQGVGLRVVELLAREKVCLMPDTPCRADACPYAAGYYDRRRVAMRALLGDEAGAPALLDADRVGAVARAHQVCPAALQHDVARHCDLVVGDVNYAFDPFARQGALVDADDGAAAVLVDEGHHLADRVREMHSAALDVAVLRRLLGEASSAGCSWTRGLRRCIRALRALPDEPTLADCAALLESVDATTRDIAGWLAEAPSGPLILRVQRAFGELLRFTEVAQLARGGEGAAWCPLHEPGSGRLALRCLAAGSRLAALCAPFAGLVVFSATLSPMGRSLEALGLPADTRCLRLPCPFPRERRLVLLVDDIDLRHAARERALPALVTLVMGLVRARPGHHLVFAPSFAYAERLATALGESLPEAEIPLQTPAMDEGARSAFLGAFEVPDGRTRIGCAVSGGIFSEGIDLPDDCLRGVIIAGLPLPAPDIERRAMEVYHGASGFDLVFRQPAMTKVLQAAGRVIRGEQDLGTICLVDRRFAAPAYRQLLPAEWSPRVLRAGAAPAAAEAFWNTWPDAGGIVGRRSSSTRREGALSP